MLEIDSAVYMESEFDVHVSNSGKDLKNLEMMKMNAQNFASQGSSPSVIAEILEADNISKLKQILKVAEQKEIDANQKREMAVEEMKNKQLEIESAYNELQAEFDLLLQNNEYDRKEGLEHIKGQYSLADTNTAGDSLDPVQLEQTLQAREKMAQDKDIKQEELKSKEKIAKEKDATTRYVADTTLKVAKENQSKAELSAKKKP